MTAHICVKCGGQLTIAKSAGGPVSVGYVSLQPGPWGRYKGTSARLEPYERGWRRLRSWRSCASNTRRTRPSIRRGCGGGEEQQQQQPYNNPRDPLRPIAPGRQ